jgi:hypothetical protein
MTAGQAVIPDPVPLVITMRQFLEGKPPGSKEFVADWALSKNYGVDLKLPDPIFLKCQACNGMQNFSNEDSPEIADHGQGTTDCFVVYTCRNCKRFSKRYALTVTPQGRGMPMLAYKLGELPAFDIEISSELRNLLADDKVLLEKALRCESACLGIGAFVYYRRILESMKGRLFDKVIEVAGKIDAGDEALTWLRSAREERQFTKSLHEIKSTGLHAIYIDGHNPLTLLYDEVSNGVHSGTDEDNLASAQRIRIVLAHLAGRLQALMLEEADVKMAMTALLHAKKAREERRATGVAPPPT